MAIKDNDPAATAAANASALAGGQFNIGTPAPVSSSPTIYPRSSTGSPASSPPQKDLTPATPYTSAYTSADGVTHPATSTPPGSQQPQNPNLPAAPAPIKSAADYTSAAENSPGVQAQLDTIRASFTDQLAKEDTAAASRDSQTNYTSVARGMVGSPDADTAENKTKDYNAASRKVIQDQESSAIEQVLTGADNLALQQEQLDQSKYTADYTNWSNQMKDLQTQAQSSFTTLAQTSNGTWEDFVKAAPDSARKIIDQTGYDPNVIPFLFNSLKTKANQLDYGQIAPIQNPDGTETVIGVNPNVPASDPNHLVKTTIDSAPQGYQTTIVGGLPYWQQLGADGKPDPNGTLFKVPSDKGQFLTAGKNTDGSTYFYNAYTGQYVNKTDGSGTPTSPNAPTSPLDQNSTLSQLLGYYVQGNSSYTPGGGYTGAVLNSLNVGKNSFSLDTPLNQLQKNIPALAAGIIAAENSPSLSKLNNGGALMWATAQAYGFDTMFGATPAPLQGSDGKQHTYASFPDSASGQEALQSYLTSLLGSGGTTSVDTQAQSYADGILSGNFTSLAQVPKQYKDKVANILDSTDKGTYKPLAVRQFTMAANQIVANYISLPQYQLTANGLPYLQRIDAAIKTPGSVSDQDLLDSLTKLNTAGNAISDAQVKLITDGRSYSDLASVLTNKLSSGGVLSDTQRQQIQTIAKAIFANYQKGYQPVYDKATAQLQASGIPEAFWTIPDLNNLSGQTASGNAAASGSIKDQTTAAGYDYDAMKAQGFTDDQIQQAINQGQ